MYIFAKADWKGKLITTAANEAIKKNVVYRF